MTITLSALRDFIETSFQGNEVVTRPTIDLRIAEYWGNHSTYTIRDRRKALERVGYIRVVDALVDNRGRIMPTKYRVIDFSSGFREGLSVQTTLNGKTRE